jgi:aryl-alcohol dehydrogenase-like predicted oxidoreductase
LALAHLRAARDRSRRRDPGLGQQGLTRSAPGDCRVARDIAAELGATSAQLALAWTMAKTPVVHPILGARRLDQLEEHIRRYPYAK